MPKLSRRPLAGLPYNISNNKPITRLLHLAFLWKTVGGIDVLGGLSACHQNFSLYSLRIRPVVGSLTSNMFSALSPTMLRYPEVGVFIIFVRFPRQIFFLSLFLCPMSVCSSLNFQHFRFQSMISAISVCCNGRPAWEGCVKFNRLHLNPCPLVIITRLEKE